MIDEQVKKGLKCCATMPCGDCENCPYELGNCKQDVLEDALALINRLEEEKEQIRKETIQEVYEWMRDNAVYSEEEVFAREFAKSHGIEVDE